MSTERRQARILAMQALCQWEAQRDEAIDALKEFLTEQGAAKGVLRYAVKLVQAFWDRQSQADTMISSASLEWVLTRMSTVDRNVMRVAVAELMEGKVPPKVAINEAIEIGREFGGEESPRFINGVLDRVMRQIGKESD